MKFRFAVAVMVACTLMHCYESITNAGLMTNATTYNRQLQLTRDNRAEQSVVVAPLKLCPIDHVHEVGPPHCAIFSGQIVNNCKLIVNNCKFSPRICKSSGASGNKKTSWGGGKFTQPPHRISPIEFDQIVKIMLMLSY